METEDVDNLRSLINLNKQTQTHFRDMYSVQEEVRFGPSQTGLRPSHNEPRILVSMQLKRYFTASHTQTCQKGEKLSGLPQWSNIHLKTAPPL